MVTWLVISMAGLSLLHPYLPQMMTSEPWRLLTTPLAYVADPSWTPSHCYRSTPSRTGLSGPRTVQWLMLAFRKISQTPTQRHQWWRTVLKLEPDAAGVEDHRHIGQVFETALVYDQLCVSQLAAFEVLARRYQLIERSSLYDSQQRKEAVRTLPPEYWTKKPSSCEKNAVVGRLSVLSCWHTWRSKLGQNQPFSKKGERVEKRETWPGSHRSSLAPYLVRTPIFPGSEASVFSGGTMGVTPGAGT